MTDSPSAGWREVYEAMAVSTPDTGGYDLRRRTGVRFPGQDSDDPAKTGEDSRHGTAREGRRSERRPRAATEP
jgi:hypothetical protein